MAHQRQKTLAPLEYTTETSSPATAASEDLTPEGMLNLVRRRTGGDQIEVATVEEISKDGVATVVLAGEARPREALSLLQYPSAAAASALLNRTVLVLVSRSGQPVILGILGQRVWDESEAAEATLKLGQEAPVTVQADKKRVELEASEEIRLTCGKSSLVMRRDGTVIVRGVTITTRATQANKIRGATVAIN